MTRKRFVKLLMSRGYSRNEANSKARAAVSAGVTYENAYFAVRIEAGDFEQIEALKAVRAVCNSIAEAMQNIIEAAKAAAEAIHGALPSMKEVASKYVTIE